MPRQERTVTCIWCNETIPYKQALKSVRPTTRKTIYYCRDFELCQARRGYRVKIDA